MLHGVCNFFALFFGGGNLLIINKMCIVGKLGD